MKLNGSLRLLALTGCLALSACGNKGAAEEAVREDLKDPDSAKFGTFYYNSTSKKACLTTNAKNEMGGYVGDRQYRLQHADQGWLVTDDRDESPQDCREMFADKAS